MTNGYLDQPTIVNNVETFAAAAMIALNGGDWYAGIGTPHSAGTKILSVSGDCARPASTNTRSASASARCWGLRAKDTQAVQVSGPSGICVAPNEFDAHHRLRGHPDRRRLHHFRQARDMFEVARNYVHFFQHESCGFCTPCRSAPRC